MIQEYRSPGSYGFVEPRDGKVRVTVGMLPEDDFELGPYSWTDMDPEVAVQFALQILGAARAALASE